MGAVATVSDGLHLSRDEMTAQSEGELRFRESLYDFAELRCLSLSAEMCSAALVDHGVDEGAAVEGNEIVDLLADAGVEDRQLQLGSDGEDDASFGRAIELGEDDTGDASGLGEETRLLQPVLAGGGVHDEEGLVRCAGDEFFCCPANLVQLLHQVGLGVETACCVGDHDVCGAGLCGSERVVKRGRGIARPVWS